MLDGHDLDRYIDENTIGVVAIMGLTYTGVYEPVEKISAALDEIQARRGLDMPIHVDGASGAMIAPFLQPDTVWDFRLPRVASINTSGHKYGLVYPGLGWVLWRDEEALPDDLIFHVSYLGGDMPTFALNFSRPGAQVLLQYYLLLRLGFCGPQRLHPRPRGQLPGRPQKGSRLPGCSDHPDAPRQAHAGVPLAVRRLWGQHQYSSASHSASLMHSTLPAGIHSQCARLSSSAHAMKTCDGREFHRAATAYTSTVVPSTRGRAASTRG
jgi:hypothetical protein